MSFATRVTTALCNAAGEMLWTVTARRRSRSERQTGKTVAESPVRSTTSACPWCHADALQRVLEGAMDEDSFEARSSYLIPAEVFQRDGQIWMRKTCMKHGIIEDMISSDAAFSARIESLYRPQDP